MADILPEKWMKGVAVTTTVLAVMTAIASSRGGACTAKTQILTAVEGSQWAYYQAKSIKENLVDAQRNLFEVQIAGAANAEQKAILEKKLENAKAEIARYDKEKNDLKAQAEGTGRENGMVARKGNEFSMAIVFFQIGIMLSSVSALLKRKEMWVTGLLFGLIAIVYLANAFFLFF